MKKGSSIEEVILEWMIGGGSPPPIIQALQDEFDAAQMGKGKAKAKAKTGKKDKKGKAAAKPKTLKFYSPIILDGKKIRKEYEAKFRRLEKKLAGKKEKWRCYEEKDVPEFHRHYNVCFGVKLQEIKTLEAECDAAEDIRLRIEKDKECTGQRSFHASYLRVQNNEDYIAKLRKEDEAWRDGWKEDAKGRQDGHGDDDDGDDDVDDGEEEDWDDEDGRDDFDAWEDEVFQDDFDDGFSDKGWRKGGKSFGSKFRGGLGNVLEDFMRFAAGSAPGGGFFRDGFDDDLGGDPVAREAKGKETYRTLCKMLHPDRNKAFDKRSQDIWNEVQEAYENQDLEKLESLLAIAEMKDKKFSPKTTCSQIVDAMLHIEESMRAIDYEIREAKRDKAWGFAAKNDAARREVFAYAEVELDKRINDLKNSIKWVNDIIKKWSVPPNPSKPKAEKSWTPGRKHVPDAPGQMYWF